MSGRVVGTGGHVVVCWGCGCSGQLGRPWGAVGGGPDAADYGVLSASTPATLLLGPPAGGPTTPPTHTTSSSDGEEGGDAAAAVECSVACGGTTTTVAVAATGRGPGGRPEGDGPGAGRGPGGSGRTAVMEWGGSHEVASAVNVASVSRREYRGPQCPAPACVPQFKNCIIKQLSAGGFHRLALEDTGRAWEWGEISGKWQPPAIVAALSSHIVTHVSAGVAFSVVCCQDGTVYSWGVNSHGQLGLGDWRVKKAVKSICGGQHSMLLTDSGKLLAFGANRHAVFYGVTIIDHKIRFGQLGLGSRDDKLTPQSVILPTPPDTQTLVSCGDCHTIVVYTWGKRDYCGIPSIPEGLDILAPQPLSEFNLYLESNNEWIANVSANGSVDLCLDQITMGNVVRVELTQFLFQLKSQGFVSCGWLHTSAIFCAPRKSADSTLGSFGVLPLSVLTQILTEIHDFKSLMRLGQTSRGMRIISSSDEVWEAVMRRQKHAKLKYLMVYEQTRELFLDMAESDDKRETPVLTKVFSLFSEPKLSPCRCLLLGLDSAGALTALYMLKLGENVCAGPNIGFCVETIPNKSLDFTIWVPGGITVLRPRWRNYYTNTECIFWIIDSQDRDMFIEAYESLWGVLNAPELSSVPLCVLANKQDLPFAASPEEIATVLQLPDIKPGTRDWAVFPTIAYRGQGLRLALDWAERAILNERKIKRH
ncbi:ADP-ribosylation factor [Pelomyxa schiedti]|nr:ADP-ribosylation factor [Pelomyxa schiedti]